MLQIVFMIDIMNHVVEVVIHSYELCLAKDLSCVMVICCMISMCIMFMCSMLCIYKDYNNVNIHLYADDTQLYVPFDPSNNGECVEAMKRLEFCIEEIRAWMTTKCLSPVCLVSVRMFHFIWDNVYHIVVLINCRSCIVPCNDRYWSNFSLNSVLLYAKCLLRIPECSSLLTGMVASNFHHKAAQSVRVNTEIHIIMRQKQ